MSKYHDDERDFVGPNVQDLYDYDDETTDEEEEELLHDQAAQTSEVKVNKRIMVMNSEFTPQEWNILRISAVVLAFVQGYIQCAFLYAFYVDSIVKAEKDKPWALKDKTNDLYKGVAKTLSDKKYSDDEIRAQFVAIAEVLGFVFSYFLGVFTTTLLVGTISPLKFGKRYFNVLILETIILCLAAAALAYPETDANGKVIADHHWITFYLACSAAGIQNTLMSLYGGGSIQTANLQGITTDASVSLARIIRLPKGADLSRFRRKFELNLILWFSFFIGGFAGSCAYAGFKPFSIMIPAGLVFGVSLGFLTYNFFRKEQKMYRKRYAGHETA